MLNPVKEVYLLIGNQIGIQIILVQHLIGWEVTVIEILLHKEFRIENKMISNPITSL